MNKKLLCAALLGGLSVVQVASAQDFDDRWYITSSAGVNIQDNTRGTRNAPFGTLVWASSSARTGRSTASSTTRTPRMTRTRI